MKTLTIKTKLRYRDDVFKLFYVSQETRLPVLLLGPPGTGKTQTFIDYAKSVNSGNLFIKQMNFDTRWEDLIGYLSLPKLKDGIIERINGIQDATYVLMDEIDKTSTSVRNLILSILREKQIFDGGKIVNCNWKLLVGTTNKEEFDEEDLPFLDRFVLKLRLDRVGPGKAQDLLSVDSDREVIINIVNVDDKKFKAALNAFERIIPDIYNLISDRTLSYFPSLIKTFLTINNNDMSKSIMDSLGYTLGVRKAASLANKIGISDDILKAKELANAYKNATDDSSKAIIIGKLVELSKKTDKESAKEIKEMVNKVINL